MVPIIKSPVGRLATPVPNMESSNLESLALNSQAGVDRPAYVLLWQLRHLWHMHGRASPSSKAWRFLPRMLLFFILLFISASCHCPCLSHSGLGWDGFEMLWGQVIMVTTSNSNYHKASPAAKTQAASLQTTQGPRKCFGEGSYSYDFACSFVISTFNGNTLSQAPPGNECFHTIGLC